MDKLGRAEEKAAAKAKEDRKSKRQKKEKSDDSDSEEEDSDRADATEMSPPPMHETLEPDNDSDLVKAQRTVFVGNVSAEAITSKSAKKTLMRHLESFFEDIADPEKGQPAHSVESLRFRSTAYASAIPKKAAFAKKEIMVETTKSTNAYAVYSSNALAREAAKRLNGTVVLDRHIRVDEVAHPAKTEPRRCVFVGNLGFVDDETNIDKANAEEGKGTRKGNKTPSDVEEGLWRTFSTCGKVESVRVPRDPQTRVGKGFAYVQFTVSQSRNLCVPATNNAIGRKRCRSCPPSQREEVPSHAPSQAPCHPRKDNQAQRQARQQRRQGPRCHQQGHLQPQSRPRHAIQHGSCRQIAGPCSSSSSPEGQTDRRNTSGLQDTRELHLRGPQSSGWKWQEWAQAGWFGKEEG
jgi:RNA recognition motif-containing protein